MKLNMKEKKILYAYGCPSHHNTVTRLKWLIALTVDPEAKSQMLHLARKIETETEERWYEAFYHHLRMEMDEYRRIRRSLRALKANTDYEEELYEEAVNMKKKPSSTGMRARRLPVSTPSMPA